MPWAVAGLGVCGSFVPKKLTTKSDVTYARVILSSGDYFEVYLVPGSEYKGRWGFDFEYLKVIRDEFFQRNGKEPTIHFDTLPNDKFHDPFGEQGRNR